MKSWKAVFSESWSSTGPDLVDNGQLRGFEYELVSKPVEHLKTTRDDADGLRVIHFPSTNPAALAKG